MKDRKHAMKAIFALALSLLMLVGSYGPARAQDTTMQPDSAVMRMHGDMMQGHMQGGGMMGMMMRSMMNGPVKRSVMQIYMLPALQDVLSLTEDQAARLEEAQQQFTQERAEIQEELQAKEEQLQEALSAEQPDMERIQMLLADRAALKANVQAAAVETAMQMKTVLSEEQRQELAAMEPMQMHRAMMSSMSMMEMMRMMQAMGGGCPMMGGMMQGNMMQGGMMQESQMPMDGQMLPEDMND